MSLTLNMVGGGGGGGLSATDALLRVQAPAGATVTITKGTTTKTDQGHENADDNTLYDYYFIIHASQFDSINPWSVVSTVDGIINTKNIVVNAPNEYNLIFKNRVPDGYQEVEYLATSGTTGAYLFTDFVLGENWFSGTTHFEIKLMFTASTGAKDLFGAYTGTNTSTFNRVYIFYKISGNLYFGVGHESSGNGMWQSTSVSNNTEYVLQVDSSGMDLTYSKNGSVVATKTLTLQPPSDSSIAVFGSSNNGVVESTIDDTRIYYCVISKNGTMLLNLIPCYRTSDSEPGMYDRVAKVFYYNQGSQSFSVGGDVN